MDATARNAQRDADRLAAMAGTFSHGGTHGRDGDTRSDISDDEHLPAAHGPILTADDLAVLGSRSGPPVRTRHDRRGEGSSIHAIDQA